MTRALEQKGGGGERAYANTFTSIGKNLSFSEYAKRQTLFPFFFPVGKKCVNDLSSSEKSAGITKQSKNKTYFSEKYFFAVF